MAKLSKGGRLCIAGVCILALLVGADVLVRNREASGGAWAMGSAITAEVKGRNAAAVLEEIFQAVDAADALMSDQMAEGQVYQLNQAGALEADDLLVRYIEAGLVLARETGGVFDITVGALSRLWDFNGGGASVPDSDAVAQALETVGAQNVTVEGHTVTLAPGTQIDLGSVGKGAACDMAMDVMRRSGVRSGVVSVGGSIAVYGAGANIGIRDPDGGAGDIVATLRVQDAVVSTTGDYEKYFEQDGVRYHHVLDATTGYPVQTGLRSATIVCESGYYSDALSTACYLLGYEASIPLLERYAATGIFIREDGLVQVWGDDYGLEVTGDGYAAEETLSETG
ncbi:MAG: FAD:protein FMN transferase [Clostridiales bacterium]|nr:FAD:protein FMN transferase [Clostridiales bacterium]